MRPGQLIEGWLIWRSSYLPRLLGALMLIAGVCYLINSLTMLLAPATAGRLFPAILLPVFLAELALALWLLSCSSRASMPRNGGPGRPCKISLAAAADRVMLQPSSGFPRDIPGGRGAAAPPAMA